ncbi:hypothetical protein [Paraglaciecola hydrolytica]|uniref:Uncharacterized protein n=1 Tax=Paraglaciecola hydrolytica TaxID=1799789 RepID=A0A136A256_9ALTE|nr:hypothetical protein [Paraglaciecola hydrolytica]KXI29315.1 hypothetical protein AX660_14330 [Paraglaciecola hydrolytica]
MKTEQVPQDHSPSYSGHKKLLYAVDESGHYTEVTSSGWEVENFATQMAVEDLHQQCLEAHAQVKAGLSSPLAYHMYKHRLDVTSLAQASGFFKWQIRRHLKPAVFRRLKPRKLNIYCAVFSISVAQLTNIPEL